MKKNKRHNDASWKANYLLEIQKNLYVSELFDNLCETREVILKARKNKHKVILAGNGTSSLTATRGAMAFLGQLGIVSASINESVFITAVANDFGYEDIFTRYVNLCVDKGDVIFLISASGKSKNLLRALLKAKKKGCTVITFSGFEENNPMRKAGDINFWVPCNDYSKVETIHSLWMSMISEFILKDEKHKVGIHGLEFK